MKDAAQLAPLVTGLAFALAFVFGYVANRVSFCTMGAIADAANFGDWRRMRMWLLAIAVAIGGAAVLQAAGLVDLSKSIYMGGQVPWVSHLVVGAVVVAGWYVSGHVGYLAEDPATLEEKFVATNSGRAESFSFVAPAAYLLELLMMWTDTTRVLTFGIAAALGMIAGSAAYALVSRTFRWESFASAEDVANHLVGATMMGFGGVTALGCTIGQGITGVSTLAVGSILTLLAIVGGSVLAIRYQTWRLERMA